MNKIVICVLALVVVAGIVFGMYMAGVFSSEELLTSESKKVGSLDIETAYTEYKKLHAKEKQMLSLEQFSTVLICDKLCSFYISDEELKKLTSEKKKVSGEEENTNTEEKEKPKKDEEKEKTKKDEKKEEDPAFKKAKGKNVEIKGKFFGGSGKLEEYLKPQSILFDFDINDDKAIVPNPNQIDLILKGKSFIETLEKSAEKLMNEDLKKKIIAKDLKVSDKTYSILDVAFANWLAFISA